MFMFFILGKYKLYEVLDSLVHGLAGVLGIVEYVVARSL